MWLHLDLRIRLRARAASINNANIFPQRPRVLPLIYERYVLCTIRAAIKKGATTPSTVLVVHHAVISQGHGCSGTKKSLKTHCPSSEAEFVHRNISRGNTSI